MSQFAPATISATDPAHNLFPSLEALIKDWKLRLTAWASDESLRTAVREALLLDMQPNRLREFIDQWAGGEFSALPPIVLLESSAIKGAAGAYAISTGTIYLNESWLASASEDQGIAVLTEELGHHLDALFGTSDSPGDEGQRFALALLDREAAAELSSTLTEEDHGWILTSEGWVAAEFAAATTGNAGGGQSFDNRQPTATTNYVIAIQGVFPSQNLTGGDPLLGGIFQFAGDFAPRGYQFCDGRLLPINQNQALFSILGTTYGGDGRTTFALPDLRGRTPIGVGQGAGLAPVALGEKVGSETITLSSDQMPAHAHGLAGGGSTDGSGGGQTFDNRQPGLGLTAAIAVQGIFPARNLSTQPALGDVGWFAGNFIPRGWMAADGQLLSISQNTALFSLLGITYGGDGRSTFALPDLRGRTVLGAGIGPGLDPVGLGEQGGRDAVSLTSSQLPSHGHTLGGGSTLASGGGQPFSTMQPYLGLNYEIALNGIFPSRSLAADGSPVEEPSGTGSGIDGLLAGFSILSTETALQEITTLAQVGASYWKATGLSDALLARLGSIRYQIADLDPGSLAFVGEGNVVTIDADASDRGWFVDGTPWDNDEFLSSDPRTGELLATDPEALRHFDLLTAIMHEQGHVLGFEHIQNPASLMYGSIGTGGRLFPAISESHPSEFLPVHNDYLSGFDSYIAAIGMTARNFESPNIAFANGQLLSIAGNEALFTLVGITYGGDGQTTFALPDFRGRTVVGAGQGPGLSSYALGQQIGQNQTTLTLSQLPIHSHTYSIDSVAPAAGNVTSTAANGSYSVGALITLTVTFSEPVLVTGAPHLQLETGPIDRFATYSTGSGTSTLSFVYTVQAGDSSADLDVLSSSALSLNGGTIKDAAGNNAVLILAAPGAPGSLGSSKNLVIDGIAPLITAGPTATGSSGIRVTSNEAGSAALYKADNTKLFPTALSANIAATLTLAAQATITSTTLKVADGAGNPTAASPSFWLGTNGADAIIGSAAADFLYGFGGNDSLTGRGGNDTLIGGAGNDSYLFDADLALGSDTLNEAGGGIDSLNFATTTTRAISLNLGLATTQSVNGNLSLTLGSGSTFENVIGGGLADTLTGNALANSLSGGGGNDTLIGGAGNDSYLFDADLALGSDTLNEAGGGIDSLNFAATTTRAISLNLGRATTQSVNSNLSLTLGSGSTFENMIGGGLADTLTGNALANSLRGGGGNDSLSGGGGNDTLIGGAGNDSYLFDADLALGSDTLNEAGGGIDSLNFAATTTRAISLNLGLATTQSVNGNLSLTLGSGSTFENVIGGGLADTLTGNALANSLSGGGGNDTLTGGGGNDTLIGGAGADRFRFSTALNGATNRDAITDYSIAQGDRIELENAVFSALLTPGPLAASAFFIGTAATNTSQRILYDKASGLLAYDADGSGAVASAIAFATLTPGLALTSSAFSVI